MIFNLSFPERTYQLDATQNDALAVESVESLHVPGALSAWARSVPLLSNITVSVMPARSTIISCRWRRLNGVGHVATHASQHHVQRMMESSKTSLAAAFVVLIVGDLVCAWERSL